MTQWGGVEVSRFALGAGFIGPANDEAVHLAYVASGWNDHYEAPHGSDPLDTCYGLWGLTQRETGIENPRDLLDPITSAAYLHKLYGEAGRTFNWHHGLQLQNGERYARAVELVDTLRLKGRTAHAMAPVGSVPGAIISRPSIATLMESAPHPGPLS